MDRIVRDGLRKLRRSGAVDASKVVVKAAGRVGGDEGEESLAYLVACYNAAKVLAAAGSIDQALTLMNMVPREVSDDPASFPELSLLALEIGEGFRKLGDPDSAEKVVGLGRDLRLKLYGKHHPKYGLAMLYAGRLCCDIERWADAAKFFDASIDGFGLYHPFAAVACADRAYALQVVAPDSPPFPEWVLTAPLPYLRRMLDHIAYTTMNIPADIRISVLINVSSEVDGVVQGAEDLARPVLEAAYQYATEAETDNAGSIGEVLEERGWMTDALNEPPPAPSTDADTEEFWTAPERDDGRETLSDMPAQFKLFEGAAEATAGRKDSAIEAFQRVIATRGEDQVDYWSAKGCLLLLERGWKLKHNRFKPETRAAEALALANLPTAIRSKVDGVKLTTRKGKTEISFLGRDLSDAEQEQAAATVQEAIAWVTERSEAAE